MSKKLKIILAIAITISLFFMGMAVAHFQLFPYDQIVGLRSSMALDPLKNIVRQSAGSPDAVEATVKNTAIQRLLIKEIPLEKYPVSSSAYVFETRGIIHVVATHGKIISFDLESYERVESVLPQVPMNLDQLIDSPLVGGKSFTENHFRVLGIYAEPKDSEAEVIYVTHHQYNQDEDCLSFTVSRIAMESGSVTSDWETLFKGTPCMRTMIGIEGGSQRFHIRQTAGGAMTPFGDNELLFSVGDYGFDGTIHESLSELPGSMFGKIYRLNKKTGEVAVFAEGLRNSQGMYTDRDGTVWSTDHGPYGGDELNIIRKGEHYGWPEVTYGIEYGNQPWPNNPEQGKHNGFQKPEYVWMNAIAPTDILRVESQDVFRDWYGDLLIGSLRDRSLHRVRITEDNRVIYSERIDIGHRIRNMQMLSNGSIALMTDGKVLVIIEDGGPVFKQMDDEVNKRLNYLERYNDLLE